MIQYISKLDYITEEHLDGFFVGWPNPPSKEKHLTLLRNSDYIWLAVDTQLNRVIGFITAITDHTLCAYIPFLEVIPHYQGQGIGTQLVKEMLHTLKDYYMIDLLCDEALIGFYKQFNMFKSQGMIIRNFKSQNGANLDDVKK
jgi:ribosomal protein S18 acetylase RimI-like enzyme